MKTNSEKSNAHLVILFLVLGLVIAIFTPGCVPSSNGDVQATSTQIESVDNTPTKVPTKNAVTKTPVTKQITVTGWLTTIWNGNPHYTVTDEQGQDTELAIDESTAQSLGGMLQFDRKRVTVTGELTGEPPRTLRVISIKLTDQQ